MKRVGAKVVMVDRYRRRGGKHTSWFDGMRGVITRTSPSFMVHLEGERLPMVFDERDFDLLETFADVSMTGAE